VQPTDAGAVIEALGCKPVNRASAIELAKSIRMTITKHQEFHACTNDEVICALIGVAKSRIDQIDDDEHRENITTYSLEALRGGEVGKH
jgi:hypothetical protein